MKPRLSSVFLSNIAWETFWTLKYLGQILSEGQFMKGKKFFLQESENWWSRAEEWLKDIASKLIIKNRKKKFLVSGLNDLTLILIRTIFFWMRKIFPNSWNWGLLMHWNPYIFEFNRNMKVCWWIIFFQQLGLQRKLNRYLSWLIAICWLCWLYIAGLVFQEGCMNPFLFNKANRIMSMACVFPSHLVFR